MKQNIMYLTLGLCLGGLIMGIQVCKQKDSMIRLLMKTNNVELAQDVPNLPIVNIK